MNTFLLSFRLAWGRTPAIRSGIGLLFLAFLFVGDASSQDRVGNTFYVDPVNGSMAGDGSIDKPWKTLEEVFSQNLIESQESSSRGPFDGSLKTKNNGSPVKAGSTLKLLNGYHGSVFARGYHNSETITIEAAEDHTPQLGGFHIQGAQKWRLKGLTVSPELAPATPGRSSPKKKNVEEKIIHFESHNHHGPVNHITVEDSTVYSADDSSAWSAADWRNKAATAVFISGSDLVVKNNRIRNVDFGITVVGDDTLVEHNTIDNFCGDGIRGGGDRVTFQYNTIRGSFDVDGNHDDAIQFFRGGGGSSHVTIRGNMIDCCAAPDRPLVHGAQGIGAFDGPYINWRVENNVVMVSNYHGISLYQTHDAQIVNNTVFDRTGSLESWILLNGCKASLARNNIASNISVIGGESITEDHNLVVAPKDSDSIFRDPKNGDLRPRPNSPAIDAGSPESAPKLDLNQAPRPRGSGMDLGAYEIQ